MRGKQSTLKMLGEGAKAIIYKIFDNPYRKLGLSWFTLRRLKYLPKTGLNSHKLFGRDTFFYNRREYLYAIKEIFVDEVYLQSLPTGSYIIDCGAHIGLSVIYLKKLCPTAKVIAFEPDPINFDVLKKNIASHGLSFIELRKEAVWINDTTISFVSDGNMSSRIGSDEGPTVQVQAIRLKDLLTRKVDFLKLDIEGAEFEVIKDIRDKLFMVDKIFIEYHGYFEQNNELNEILQIATDGGFRYYIKEATPVYKYPFLRNKSDKSYDVQLNIFCFRL